MNIGIVDEQWMSSVTEAATSSALSLLQLGRAADVLGVSPIAVPALTPSLPAPPEVLNHSSIAPVSL